MPKHGESTKQNLVARVWRACVLSWDAIVGGFAIVGVLLMVALQIPGLGDAFRKLPIDFSGLGGIAVAVMLTSIFVMQRQLQDAVKAEVTPRYVGSLDELYPILFSRAENECRSPGSRVIDVLGLTLYTAWPTLSSRLRLGDWEHWSIRLTLFHDDNPSHLSEFVTPDWINESSANLHAIQDAISRGRFADRNVNFSLRTYRFMPAVHGFRLGNGDLFISVLKWRDDAYLDKYDYAYEFVPHEDHSPIAQALRDLFDSWFRRAYGGGARQAQSALAQAAD